MNPPEVRLHDVAISGKADRAALLAAIERAVAEASAAGTPRPEGVRSAVADSVERSKA